MLRYGFGLVLVVAAVAACSSSKDSNSSGVTEDAGSPGPGSMDGSSKESNAPDASDASATAATPSDSCVDVLRCSANCTDPNDTACVQACLDRSTGKSRDLANALYKCILDNACQDSDCTNTKCSAEVDGCLSDVSQPTTPPAGTTPTTGSVPAGMVGTWLSNGSAAVVWTFEADGKTVAALEIDSSLGTCSYKTSVSSTGITVATADTYVYHRLAGSQILKKCTSSDESALAPADLTYRYALATGDDGKPTLTIQAVGSDGTVSTATVFRQ